MTEQSFRIPEQNYQNFLEAIKRLNKKAKRIRAVPIQVMEGELEIVRFFDEETKTMAAEAYQHCTVIGTTPRINGWEFIASIELDEEGLPIINAVPGMTEEGELTPFRSATNWCDHCKINQRRTNVYILRSEDHATYKQVGSTCLEAFLGYANPMTLAAMAEMLIEAVGIAEAAEEEDWGGGGGNRNWLFLEEWLSWVACCVRHYGYLSKRKVEENYGNGWATSERALHSMFGKEKEFVPEQQDRDDAKSAITWMQANEEWNLGNDFQHDLYAIAHKEAIQYKNCGKAAYIVEAWRKAMAEERKRQRRKGPSQHQGQVGERLSREVTCEDIHTYTNSYGEQKVIITFEDEEGNRYKWFTRNIMVEEEQSYLLTGKVLRHDDYRGECSTILSNCRVKRVDHKKLAG